MQEKRPRRKGRQASASDETRGGSSDALKPGRAASGTGPGPGPGMPTQGPAPAGPPAGRPTPTPTTAGPAVGPTPNGPTADGPATAGPAAPAPAPEPAPAQQPPAVGHGRPTRVRRRLTVAVAVVAVAVAGAAAPGLLAAVRQVHDGQSLVTLAGQTQHALTLAHALADERDEVTAYLAAGRPKDARPGKQRTERVDRRIAELRAGAPAALRADLDKVAPVRAAALTGKESALDAHEAYGKVILRLHRLAERLAARIPAGAREGAQALADLDTAVEQTTATRGLLLAALALPQDSGTTVTDPVTGLQVPASGASAEDQKQSDALIAAARLARLREQAAYAEFKDGAPASYTSSYDSTVSGPAVSAAEEALDGLTDSPGLSAEEQGTDQDKLDEKLTARIELMRGAESSLSDRRTKDLAALRDDDVTALEIRAALAAVCLLLAVAAGIAAARGVTRPLAVLRRGTARLAEAAPEAAEPIRFTGRDDEFAQVVRSVNALLRRTAELPARAAVPRPEPDAPAAADPAAEEAAAAETAALRAGLEEATARLARLTDSVEGTFVGLALRTLALVERQLAVIEGLEESEEDPDRLATLFRLDHLATVMRRHSENLLVLAGAEHGHQHQGQVPLVDVVRAAVSEIERYERVTIVSLPPHAELAGFAADDLSHLLAELLENATVFSPPEGPVELSGWLLESGDVMLSVADEGIGMAAERLTAANARLADPDPAEPARPSQDSEGLGLGFYVVARLAGRHGVRVRLREQKQGGIAAVVVLPASLVTDGGAGQGAGQEAQPGDARRAVPAQQDTEPPDTRPRDPGPEDTGGLPVPAPAGPPAGEPVARTGANDPLIAAAERTLELAPPQPPATAGPEPGPPPAAEPAGNPYAAANPYAIGPDRHERAADRAPAGEPGPPRDPGDTGAHRLTGKGLPKRRPRITAPAPAPAPRARAVDPEALRRRLGGFQRGAIEGRRDVAAEIASGMPQQAHDGVDRAAGPGPRPPAAHLTRPEGDSAEEASS